MLPGILLSVALTVGQASDAETPAAAPLPANPPAVDRWVLMHTLQGTWPAWMLDAERIRVYGWTDLSFTGSTARDSNLPLGFNYKANECLLQQNWLRVERPV